MANPTTASVLSGLVIGPVAVISYNNRWARAQPVSEHTSCGRVCFVYVLFLCACVRARSLCLGTCVSLMCVCARACAHVCACA